jgi:tRNA G18 (ribose-2'-O)-methylase SpoU
MLFPHETRSPSAAVRCFSLGEVISFSMHPTHRVIPVESLDYPELAPYRTMRQPVDHLRRGIFVAEGEKVVLRLMKSALTIESMLLTPEWHERLFRDAPHTGEIAFTVFVAAKELLEEIVGFHLHQGIMAVGRVPASPPLSAWASTLGAKGLLVALDGLVNSENVGVIVRNAAGFGVDAVLSGETSSSPYLRRAVRNSMGAVFSIPVFGSEALPGSLRLLHDEHAFEIIGADPGGGESLYDARCGGRVCLVLGNEGNGLSERVLASCTRRIAIPMQNGTDSLNVANASAVFLYELSRPRSERIPR